MSESSNNDNRNKSLSGKAFDKRIKSILEELLEKKVIKSFQRDVNFGHKGFENEGQFLANYVIETNNDKFVIVRRSNSYRSDRSKIGLYDILGIREKSDYREEIIASL